MSQSSSEGMMLVEATQLKEANVEGSPSTYAWVIALGDKLATMVVVKNKMHHLSVVPVEPNPEGLEDLPRTSLRLREPLVMMNKKFYDLVTTTAFFRIPNSVYEKFVSSDENDLSSAMNSVFLYYGMNLSEDAI